MPPSRISIYPTETLWAALRGRSEGPDSAGLRSATAAIEAMCDRYERLVRDRLASGRIRLSLAEWSLILDALNGCWMEGWSVAYLRPEVEDGIRLTGLDRKRDVDGPALLARLGEMDYPELVAIVDVAERFWAVAEDDRPTQAILVELGVPMADVTQ